MRGGLIVFFCRAFHFTKRVASIPTSCLDISAYWCVLCLQDCRVLFCHCIVCVLFDIMFSTSVSVSLFVHSCNRVFLLCWRLDRVMFLISMSSLLQVVDKKNAVFIVVTGKTVQRKQRYYVTWAIRC